ncbi:MAG: hypothetical protein IKS51_05135 [Erysipelotrichaceae bacterium]|nr:hypothetical protein [Erysipelotrichaceae bacterium]
MGNTEENKIFETETVTIPDFVEDKTETPETTDSSTGYSDPDLSIFKMTDEELYGDDDDDEDETHEKKSGVNLSLILCAIAMLLLLATSVAAVYYAYKQHQAYVTANASYLQLQANENNYKKQIADKDAQIADLNKQIEELKSSSSSSSPSSSDSSSATGTLIYKVVDGPLSFRKAPGMDADLTTYNGNSKAENGTQFQVMEIIDDEYEETRKWAKINDEVYFCIGFMGEVWAEKVN